jgi:hypothetical protein
MNARACRTALAGRKEHRIRTLFRDSRIHGLGPARERMLYS